MKKTPRNHILLRNDEFGRDLAEQVNSLWKGTPAEIIIPEKKEWWSPLQYLEGNAYSHAAMAEILKQKRLELLVPGRILERDPLLQQEKVSLDVKRITEIDRTLSKEGVYLDLGLILDFSGVNHKQAMYVYDQLPEKDLEALPFLLLGWPLARTREGMLSFEYTGNQNSILPGKVLNQGIGSKHFLPLPQGDKKKENLGLNRLIYGRLHVLGGLINTGEYDTLAYSNRCVFALKEGR